VIDGGGDLRGLLTRDGIIRALAESGPDTPVARVMDSDIPTVSRWTRMDDIVPLLAGGAEAVGVTGEGGRCVGYITWGNLMEELLISRAFDRQAASRDRSAAA
jgi:predicted transcriptional regulator